jgi:hypothetical protein
VVTLANDPTKVTRDRRTRCKHPSTLSILRKQQRYDRDAFIAEPDIERDAKSDSDIYKSVYSTIAPLVLVDGHTTLVHLVSQLVFLYLGIFDLPCNSFCPYI